MAIIRGDNTANTISATGPNDTIFGLSGFDHLSSTFERADLRGGWGQDQLSVDYTYTIDPTNVDMNAYPFSIPFPLMRWSLSGDQGNDKLTVNVAIDTDPSLVALDVTDPFPVADIVMDGGDGDDTLTVNASVTLELWGGLGPSGPVINTAIIDLAGNNNVLLDVHNEAWDATPEISTLVILGDGNDTVTANGFTEAYNTNGISVYDVDLGNGNNAATFTEQSGNVYVDVTAGDGTDDIKVFMTLDGGNSTPTTFYANLNVGAGDDTVTIDMMGHGWSVDYSDIAVAVDLGDGTNAASLDVGTWGTYRVVAGTGNDTVHINAMFFLGVLSSANPYGGIFVDAGAGLNDVSISMLAADPFSVPSSDQPLPFANVVTGSDADQISLSGGAWNTVSSGAGNDTITAGSGTDTITMGSGADTLTIDRSIFVSTSGGTQRFTITDFSLTDGDKVVLSNWNLPALGGTGVIDDAGDLQALKTAGGDVLSFVQVGSGALLTLNLGNGELGEILFQNLDISAPPPPPPPTDPKMNLAGTYGNDTLTGGNNDDIIFLRRGRDVATGGDGADAFRFNAVNSHNANGDHHVITDLDFLEGDELRFQNFGPSWADNSTDPANYLEYQAGTFNSWIADSLADLRELRDSGAITAALLAGGAGTQIAFHDQGGDLVMVDLWGMIV